MLKQAIREMEDSIAEVTQQTAKAMAHEKDALPQAPSGTAREARTGNNGPSRPWKPATAAWLPLARKSEHEKLVAALNQMGVARDGCTVLQHQVAGMRPARRGQRSLSTLRDP